MKYAEASILVLRALIMLNWYGACEFQPQYWYLSYPIEQFFWTFHQSLCFMLLEKYKSTHILMMEMHYNKKAFQWKNVPDIFSKQFDWLTANGSFINRCCKIWSASGVNVSHSLDSFYYWIPPRVQDRYTAINISNQKI